MYVVLNGTQSASLPVILGVLQGSALSAILILVFINDIGTVLHKTSIKLFADDSLTYMPVKNLNGSVINCIV